MEITKYVLLILLIITVGFLLGWLFPVEGPMDYIYDNYKAQKCAVKNGPLIIESPQEELNFEEEEYLLRLISGDEE